MIKYNLSGTWRTVKYAYARVSNSWKDVSQIYIRTTGTTWKPMWKYAWNTGSWGTCASPGTQSRSVVCKRTDNDNTATSYTVDDKYCTKMVGTKPATSQSCTYASEERFCWEANTWNSYQLVYSCEIDGGANTSTTSAWIVSSGTDAGGSFDQVMIMWDYYWSSSGESSGTCESYSVSNDQNKALTSYTSGGYTYLRGTYRCSYTAQNSLLGKIKYYMYGIKRAVA